MATSSVRLVAVTKPVESDDFFGRDPEGLVAYCARVSSPNQENPDYARLLKYCLDHHHYSVFEIANMVVEIETSRAISQQILRHRSFSFQEHSQRYSTATEALVYPARRQDEKNRQNSIDDLPEHTKQWFLDKQWELSEDAFEAYEDALGLGIAKEQARFLLPLSTKTRLYANGTLRSWITYIGLRTDPSTQLEHREIAEQCKTIFVQQFPMIAEALGWQ